MHLQQRDGQGIFKGYLARLRRSVGYEGGASVPGVPFQIDHRFELLQHNRLAPPRCIRLGR